MLVGGQQILDAVLVVNEYVDSRLRQGRPGVICKLNIENVYNNVCWGFLMSVLELMGFGLTWRRWMYFCISTVRMSVLINGALADFF